MLLESVEPMEPEYHNRKLQELLNILEGIMGENKKLFTCILNDIARQLQKVEGQSKNELIEALTKDLQAVKLELNKKKMMNDQDIFWKHLLYYIAGAGVAVAGAFFSSTISAGASELYRFLSTKSHIIVEVAKAYLH